MSLYKIPKLLLQCSYCPRMVERVHPQRVVTCYDCRKDKMQEAKLKRLALKNNEHPSKVL